MFPHGFIEETGASRQGNRPILGKGKAHGQAAVILLGHDEHPELLSGLDQGVGHFHDRREGGVDVTCSSDEEQVALKFLGQPILSSSRVSARQTVSTGVPSAFRSSVRGGRLTVECVSRK
jgi:hypothetical protein